MGEYTRDEKEHHHCKVGGTCREQFTSSFRAVSFQGAQDDVGNEEHAKMSKHMAPGLAATTILSL